MRGLCTARARWGPCSPASRATSSERPRPARRTPGFAGHRRRRTREREPRLMGKPARTPPRMLATPLQHGGPPPPGPSGAGTGQPGVHALPRHPEVLRDRTDRPAVTDDRQHSLIPLPHDTQLHQHAESVKDQPEPVSSISRNRVKHQPEPNRQASGGVIHITWCPRQCAGSGHRNGVSQDIGIVEPSTVRGCRDVVW